MTKLKEVRHQLNLFEDDLSSYDELAELMKKQKNTEKVLEALGQCKKRRQILIHELNLFLDRKFGKDND